MQKLAIITGGNAGIGYHCAERALSEGLAVCLLSRDLVKATAAKEQLEGRFNNAQIIVRKLDLADLKQVINFTQNFEGNWDLLINNAGAKIERPFKRTPGGHEWHIGVNHLGHFALTAGLLDKANPHATVTSVSSIVARKGSLDFLEDVRAENFNESQAYANSKLMNLVFSQELAKRLTSTTIKSTAGHPGFARASAYGSKAIRVAEYVLAHSAWLGSDSIWKATKAANGSYLAPRHFELWGKASSAFLTEVDSTEASSFWKKSELLTGIKFPI
jgi:NAD(P)-dependent dehydrogenase (short-subunit alcohol dehydrogenase family)